MRLRQIAPKPATRQHRRSALADRASRLWASLLAVALVAAMLTTSPASATPDNVAPVADAGADQTAVVGDTLTLSGAGSSDGDGDDLTYRWTLEGPTPGDFTQSLDGNSSATPSFALALVGTYTATLVVSDGIEDSEADSVALTVTSGISVDWSCDGVAVTSPVRMSRIVVAQGDAHTRHVARGGTSWSLSDTPGITTIWVSARNNNSGDGPGYGERFDRPVPDPCGTTNQVPVADAGADQTVVVGDLVTLDGTGSSDADGDQLSYAWTLTSPTGSTSVLEGSDTAGPTFTPDVAGSYTAELVVNDGTENSLSDTVTITVNEIPNETPVADAGSDQEAVVGETVTLDGTGSSDADGDQLSYAWTLTSPTGSTSALEASDTAGPTFTPDVAGDYTAELTVNDGTQDSPADTVSITVSHRPTADAGEDQTVTTDDLVTLDGTGSSDGDNDPLTYSWSLTSTPAGSTAQLSDPLAAQPTFTADVAGQYTVALQVTDGRWTSTEDTVTITAQHAANEAPTADAGEDQTAVVGDVVTLNGTRSIDPEGQTVTYSWTLTTPSGSTATLDNPAAAAPTITVDLAGTYTAELVVNDGTQDSPADTVTIAVTHRPVADAGADQTVTTGDLVTLDGTGSSDGDNDPLTYSWSLTSAPARSTVQLSDPLAAQPTFTADVAGQYTVTLQVTDGQWTSAPDTVTITVNEIPNETPVADAGDDTVAAVDDTVTLDGTNSSDADSDPLTYDWNLTGPPGSAAELDDFTAAEPTFTADVAGTYTAELVVNDGTQDSPADTVTITVTHRPAADAGADQTVTTGDLVTLDGTGSTDADGDSLTYAWTLTTPTGSSAALSDPLASQPTFTADVAGQYTVALQVTDGRWTSTGDTVTITAQHPANQVPVADAGQDQSALAGDTVTLDGSLSSDADGDDLTFAWVLTTPSGSMATLDDATAVAPSFTPDVAGSYTASLTVSDGTDTSAEDSVTISVTLPAITVTGPDLQTYSSGDLRVTLERPAPVGGQLLSLTSDAPQVLTPLASVTVAAGATVVDVPVASGSAAGTAVVTASGDGYTTGSATVTVAARSMSLQVEPLVGVGRTIPATIALAAPAPAGGLTVNVSSSDPTLVTVDPATVQFAEGETTGQVEVTGQAEGSVVLTASALGYTDATAETGSTNSTVSVGNVPVLSPGQTSGLPISLSEPAPVGGTTILLESSDTSIVTVESSVVIPEGAVLPTANPQVTGQAVGSAVITARAAGYAPHSRTATVELVLTLSPSGTITLNEGRSQTMTVGLSGPAPTGGLEVTLASLDTDVFTVPATVTVPAGQTTASFGIQGVGQGDSQLTVSAPGAAQLTRAVRVTAPPQIATSVAQVGEDLQVVANTRLMVAPTAPTDITLTVADESTALLSTSAATVGSKSITLAGVTSANWQGFAVQGLAEGTTTLTVSADGYADATSTITVTGSGFHLTTGDFTTSTFSGNTAVHVDAYALSTSGALWSQQELRPGASATLIVTNSNDAVGTLTETTLTLAGDSGYRVSTAFDPATAGTTTVAITQPDGFTQPSNGRTALTATVTAPAIAMSDVTVGKDLQAAANTRLTVVPPTPTDLTLTVTDESTALLSTDAATVGSKTITLAGVTSANWQGFAVQGLTEGTTTLTVSADGYATTTATLTVRASGFHLSTGDFSTTTFSGDTAIHIDAYVLSATGTLWSQQELRPGTSATVQLTNTDDAVGSLTEATLTLPGNSGYRVSTAFDPATAGTTTVAIIQPDGFTQPGNGRTALTATVTAPAIAMSDVTVGKDLQVGANTRLTVVPPTPTDITLTVADGSTAVISTSPATVGSRSITLAGVTSANWQGFTVQGLTEGTTTLTVSADGYATTTATLTVRASGFHLSTGDFTTSTFSGDTAIHIDAYVLSATGTLWSQQELRPGTSATVQLTNSHDAVGSLTEATLTLAGNSGYRVSTAFDPATAGTTTVAIIQPDGFTQPGNGRTSLTATVTPPALSAGNVSVGTGQQGTAHVRFTVAPPAPTDITLTVASESTALLATSAEGPGLRTITLEDVSNTNWQAFTVRGLAPGTTTLTVSAPGYADSTAIITVTG